MLAEECAAYKYVVRNDKKLCNLSKSVYMKWKKYLGLNILNSDIGKETRYTNFLLNSHICSVKSVIQWAE